MQKVVSFALLLSFCVVILGVYTRLSDAGLGCPDWPYCYGKLVLPSTETGLDKAQKAFPQIPIEKDKAWTEMVHRYAAGLLGLAILTIGLIEICKKNWKIPLALILLLFFQAILGMWTVTMKLMPLVVMSHLSGGMLIFSFMGLLYLKVTGVKPVPLVSFRPWIRLGLGILMLQILLGGWVSSNYAGIACLGFPTCNGHWIPQMDLVQGFSLQQMFNHMGINHQGGLLNQEARVAIQYLHRIGALVTGLYLLSLSCSLILKTPLKVIRRLATFILLLVVLQISLGVINVLYLLPLPVAVAHNGIATLLLFLMMALVFLTRKGEAINVDKG